MYVLLGAFIALISVGVGFACAVLSARDARGKPMFSESPEIKSDGDNLFEALMG